MKDGDDSSGGAGWVTEEGRMWQGREEDKFKKKSNPNLAFLAADAPVGNVAGAGYVVDGVVSGDVSGVGGGGRSLDGGDEEAGEDGEGGCLHVGLFTGDLSVIREE